MASRADHLDLTNSSNRKGRRIIKAFAFVLLLGAGTAFAAGNPCAASKPDLDARTITRPAGYKPARGDVRLGEKLWHDTRLSSNGLACDSCHANHGAFQASFAKPYPHLVQMAKDRAGIKVVHLDEMIQVCMAMPMAAKPLPWKSQELAALTAYTRTVQRSFKPGATAPANPCSAKPANPCATKPANPYANQ